jgi:hypothetical protein
MRAAAGFHADSLDLQLRRKTKQLKSKQLFAHDHLAVPVEPN